MEATRVSRGPRGTEASLSKLRKAVANSAANGRRRARRYAIRLGIRAGLVVTMLGAMGSFALVAGGITAGDVLAPQAPDKLNAQPAAVVLPPLEPRLDGSTLPMEPALPSVDFVATVTGGIVANQAKGRLGEDALRAYASIAGWPAQLLDEIVVVARCESHNRAFITNGVMRGLMQLDPMWFSYTGVSLETWDAPIANLEAAFGVYQYDLRRGNPAWHQWACKPDGTVAPSAVVGVPGLATDVEAADGPEPARADSSPATPAPGATPAPWEQKPAWPPKP